MTSYLEHVAAAFQHSSLLSTLMVSTKDSIEMQPLRDRKSGGVSTSTEPAVAVVDVVENTDAERWAWGTARRVS